MAAIWGYTKYPLYLFSSVVAVAGSALYYFQNEIIYPRNVPLGARTEVPRPSQFGLDDSEELTLATPDGETLSAFLIHPGNKAHACPVTFLMFHGNAGNIGHRIPVARILAEDMNCTVLMLEYRGYGLSSGSPSEKGIVIDAQTGLDYIRSRADLKHNGTVVYGQSIGGAVAVDLVARNLDGGDIAGLVLENTFLSIAKMIPSVIPAARFVTPLCHEYWRSENVISSITKVPILFLSGLKDEIVPPTHMRQLFKLARSKKLVWREFPNGDHNSTVAESGYFDAIDEFIAYNVLKAKGGKL